MKNRRMMLEKNRLGPEGATFGYELGVHQFGVDQYGDAITECHIEPVEYIDRKAAKDRKEPESVRKLRAALVEAVMSYSPPDGVQRPHVEAVPLAAVRAAFDASWATGEEKLSAKEAAARRQAWNRGLKAVRGDTMQVEIIGDVEWIWAA
jgi:hypothetical protein